MNFKIINNILEENNPISFTVKNSKDGNPVLFINNFSNELILTLANNTSQVLTLKEGTPVTQKDIKQKDFTNIYLSFPGLTKEVLEAVKSLTDGWSINCFTSPSSRISYLSLAPTKTIKVEKSSKLEIKLGNIKTGGKKAERGTLTIDYYHLEGNQDSGFQELNLAYLNPPSPDLKDLHLIFKWKKEDQVVITDKGKSPIDNQLSFVISNPDFNEPLVSEKTPWGKEKPSFTVSFISGVEPGGYGALATEEQLNNISLTNEEIYKDKWDVQPQAQAKPIYWKLYPQDHEILGVKENASVQFKIDHIITTISPGVTFMYIQYNNIPGYNDGATALMITKVKAEPKILDFRIDKENPYFGETVTIDWKTYGGNCRLVIDGNSQHVNPEGTKKILAEKLTATTTISLYCEKDNPSIQVSQTKACNVKPIQIDFKTVPSTLTPYEYFHEGVEISWEVVGAKNCELITDGTVKTVDKKANDYVKPTKTTAYTLSCYNSDKEEYKVKQTRIINAQFDITKVFYPKDNAVYKWTLNEGSKEAIKGVGSKIIALKCLKTNGSVRYPKGIAECLCVLRQDSDELEIYPYKEGAFLPVMKMPIPPNTLDFSYLEDLQLMFDLCFVTSEGENIKTFYGNLDGYGDVDLNFTFPKQSLKAPLSRFYMGQISGPNDTYFYLNSSEDIKIFGHKFNPDILKSCTHNAVDFLVTEIHSPKQMLYWIDGVQIN